MSMAHSSIYDYFWILMTTLAYWVVKCDKLDFYSFPVYTTVSCPRNQSDWRSRSSAINCTENNGYMCIPNENITQLLEFCYRYPRIPIEKDICLILKKSTSLVDAYSCKQFRNGCPDKLYWSDGILEYPSCLSIGNRCFLDEPLCKDEGITTIGPSEVTQGTTNVDLGSTILNTSLGNTPIPDIDGSNTWVWILVIGVFLIVFTLVCVLIFIIRRGNLKTLGERHKEEETIPLKMDISGEREFFKTEEIPLMESKNELKETEGNQELNDESLLLPANRKTLNEENSFEDSSLNNINRKQFEEEIEETKPDDNSLSDYAVEEQCDIQCIDETSKIADFPSKDVGKEEYSSSNKYDISSYLGQQEGSDRINSEKLKMGEVKL
ncbi:uncharacterized protein LOC134269962 [Saccostrea cucullata]|uniref:uncharacterized protein LOC134269962 n=1 Tax=Saccostrea cuccullata TaxID=36930 RepID=UPI002ED2B733